MKKDNALNKTIKVLTALCVAAAICLVALVGICFVKDKNSSVAFVSGADAPADITTKADETTVSVLTENSTATENVTVITTTVPPLTNNVTTTTETSTQEKTTADEEKDRIIVNPEQAHWNLVVVNAGREMPEGYVPKLETVAGTSVKMDYRVAPWYDKMYYAAKEDGITLTPFSGYRSYERQKINYNNLTEKYMSQYNLTRKEAAKKAATVILPPGTSEHNLGLAMDICNTYDSFANQKEYAWLMQHAHEYGFILRYTADKQDITGIVPEPWHWRYVGVEYAEKIKNSGLCLEEYLDSIGVKY